MAASRVVHQPTERLNSVSLLSHDELFLKYNGTPLISDSANFCGMVLNLLSSGQYPAETERTGSFTAQVKLLISTPNLAAMVEDACRAYALNHGKRAAYQEASRQNLKLAPNVPDGECGMHKAYDDARESKASAQLSEMQRINQCTVSVFSVS